MTVKLKRIEARVKTDFRGIITLEELREAFGLPADAEVTVRVPGGGDWSNEDITMGSKEASNGQFDEILVTWNETTEQLIKGKPK